MDVFANTFRKFGISKWFNLGIQKTITYTKNY